MEAGPQGSKPRTLQKALLVCPTETRVALGSRYHSLTTGQIHARHAPLSVSLFINLIR